MLTQAQFEALNEVLTDMYVSVAGSDGPLEPDELKVILDGGNAAIAALVAGLVGAGKVKPAQVTALIALDTSYRDQLLEI